MSEESIEKKAAKAFYVFPESMQPAISGPSLAELKIIKDPVAETRLHDHVCNCCQLKYRGVWLERGFCKVCAVPTTVECPLCKKELPSTDMLRGACKTCTFAKEAKESFDLCWTPSPDAQIIEELRDELREYTENYTAETNYPYEAWRGLSCGDMRRICEMLEEWQTMKMETITKTG